MVVIKGKEKKIKEALKPVQAKLSKHSKKILKRRQDAQPVQTVAGAP
jgi:prefoldin subunit 5